MKTTGRAFDLAGSQQVATIFSPGARSFGRHVFRILASVYNAARTNEREWRLPARFLLSGCKLNIYIYITSMVSNYRFPVHILKLEQWLIDERFVNYSVATADLD